MDATQLCPICKGPLPADTVAEDSPILADCPSCGAALVRVADARERQPLDSSSEQE
jgi:predicted RNA-binding Zn-ribbon protein involved in translation (DUF1610 family)